jgi:hypothetical protein
MNRRFINNEKTNILLLPFTKKIYKSYIIQFRKFELFKFNIKVLKLFKNFNQISIICKKHVCA